MNRTLFAAALAAASLLAAPGSLAAIPEKGSVAVFAGLGPSIPFDGDYDIGFHFEGGGEYYFSKSFALRGTLSFARSGAEGGSDVTIGGLEAAAVYASRRGDWAPFVSGGFGLYRVDAPGDGSSEKLGANFGAGTEYYLDRRTTLAGQLSGRFIGSAGGRTSSYLGVIFGVKYHF